MKGITLYQPYAYAIIAGYKKIETRKWWTDVRGTVFIHSSKFLGFEKLMTEEEKNVIMSAMGNPSPKILARGGIIGTVELVDCVKVEKVRDKLEEDNKTAELTLGDYSDGRFAWILENPKELDKVIFCNGRQGWWEYTKL